MKLKTLTLLAFIISTQSLAGLPLVRQATSNSLQLEDVLVEVNTERQLVKAKDTLEIVRGDLLVIRDVWLVDRSRPVPVVVLDGYTPKRKDVTNDARGKLINTATDLHRENPSGSEEEYLLHASGSGLSYGDLRIHVKNPVFQGVELKINGVRKFIRGGDPLELGPTDKISVDRVHTNIRGNENVRHELKTMRDSAGNETRELRFVRGDDVFGSIPIKWRQ